MGILTEVLKAAKPWLDAATFLFAIVATVLSIYSTLVARATRRSLAITQPEDSEVNQEWASVSGIGARPRWRVLILQRTNRWYLQEGFATPNKNGYWFHEKCHFRPEHAERTVLALTVPPSAIEKLRLAFGGWGPGGNHTEVKDWDDLMKLLNGIHVRGLPVRYKLSAFRRIRRVPPGLNGN